jgi:hypothetical protein
MSRILRHILIAAALLFGQHAAQVHALSHLGDRGSDRSQSGKLPLGHPAAQCLAFHAVDSALPNLSHAPLLEQAAPRTVAYFVLPLPLIARFEFDSRAPPVLS